jgi:hypothetical protein
MLTHNFELADCSLPGVNLTREAFLIDVVDTD